MSDLINPVSRHLNAHGYAFQDAAVTACGQVNVRDSYGVHRRWVVLGREVPVELHGREFHIDGVLKFPVNDTGANRFIIVECKKTDPKYSEWVFGRPSLPSAPVFICDSFLAATEDGTLSAKAIALPFDPAEGYEFATERKLQDTKGTGLGRTLDEAIAQAFRGVGGFAHVLGEWTRAEPRAIVLPMIITTGSLVTVEEPFDKADLTTGEVGQITTRSPQWLWLSTNISRSLMPRVAHRNDRAEWGSFHRRMSHESTRGLIITTVSGIPAALNAVAIATQYVDNYIR